MAIDQSKRMERIVQVAKVRKQRLANAAADARRKLAVAEEDRTNADKRARLAQSMLRDAGLALRQNPASDQFMVWRKHCAAQVDIRIAEHAESEESCEIAQGDLAQSTRALQRQDLRHDHLAGQVSQLRHRLMRASEARQDDEAQGSGQQNGATLL